MKKRFLLSLICIVLLIGFVVGCGKKQSNDAQNNKNITSDINLEDKETKEEPMFTFYAFDEELPLNITVDDFLKKGWHMQMNYMSQTSKPGEEYASLTVEKDGEREKTGKADGLNLSIKNNTSKDQLIGGCNIWAYKTTMGSGYNISLGNGIKLSSTLEEVEEKCGIPTDDKYIYKSSDGSKVEYTYFSKDEAKRLDIECRNGKVFYIKLYSLLSGN
ncbi:MAG: hypothetical protein LBH71_00560 [Oscillospiraceae bacterium]|jgi:hypothetical protein|nr:hypothetical protein [Oscillospiraceae bacterium]